MNEPWNGVPENPERGGYHWVELPCGSPAPYEWREAGECERGRWGERWLFDIETEIDPRTCRYIGPALTPAEIAVASRRRRVQQEWRRPHGFVSPEDEPIT